MAAGAATVVAALASCGAREAGEDVPAPEQAGSAHTLLIDADDLGRGWRDSSLPQDTFRTEICGVDTEPVAAVDTAHARYARGGLGPFVEEYVRRYEPGAGSASAVVSRLQEAVPTCGTFVARGDRPDSPRAVVEVTPLPVEGLPDDAVAFRMAPRGRAPVVNDVVFLTRGDALVVLVSYAVKGTPQRSTLEAAVRSVPAQG